MGGEKQRRAHAENVQQHPAQRRDSGDKGTRIKTERNRRKGGREEEGEFCRARERE